MSEPRQSRAESFQARVSDRIATHLRNRLAAGLFVLLPILFTLLVLAFAFNFLDGILNPALEELLDRSIPGLGIAALLLLIYVCGLIMMSRLGANAMRQLQRPMLAVPVVRTIFSVGKKVVDSMSGEATVGLNRVVMIEYPRPGLLAVGFLTGFTTVSPDRTLAIVYVPTAPIPNSGWIAYVSVEDVYDTNLSPAQAMQTVLSSGLEYPDRIDIEQVPELPGRGESGSSINPS